MATAKEIIEKADEAFGRHDLEGILDLYADDAEIISVGGQRAKGKAEIRDFNQSFLDAFPDAKLRVTRQVEAGNTLVEESVFTGTHTGVLRTPMGDVPPTGKAIELPGVDIFVVENDRIVSEHLMFDRLQMMEQLGLVPAPAGAPG